MKWVAVGRGAALGLVVFTAASAGAAALKISWGLEKTSCERGSACVRVDLTGVHSSMVVFDVRCVVTIRDAKGLRVGEPELRLTNPDETLAAGKVYRFRPACKPCDGHQVTARDLVLKSRRSGALMLQEESIPDQHIRPDE